MKLEFIDYSDPEYVVDQGVTDEFFSSQDDTEEKIEEMREERRRRNDEFQYETYHASVLKNGEVFKGEWTVYRTSTFLPGQEDKYDEYGLPMLVKDRSIMKVVSSGRKSQHGEYIVHEERMASEQDFEEGEWNSMQQSTSLVSLDLQLGAMKTGEDILVHRYWPAQLCPLDFRGPGGIMCVGNAYTICDGVPLDEQGKEGNKFDGPFSILRTEVGIHYKRMRYRIKLDYRIKGFGPNDQEYNNGVGTEIDEFPALYLCTMIVCRETRERWPRYDRKENIDDAVSANLFGPAGAQGGLYDPPPVGTEEQATQYMLLDLEGGATALFPYIIDQHPESHGGNGWVTTLDWTPGRIRYQVDRKVLGGIKLRGLRTLELSEVESAEADKWRPRDGGADMRQ